MEHLWILGSAVHVKTMKKVSKLEERRNVMIFIRNELGSKAYRCLDPLNFYVSISRYVINLNVGTLVNRVVNLLISPSLLPLMW